MRLVDVRNEERAGDLSLCRRRRHPRVPSPESAVRQPARSAECGRCRRGRSAPSVWAGSGRSRC